MLLWLLVGSISSLSMGGVEFAVAVSMQLILMTLGFDLGDNTLSGYLNDWSPSETVLLLSVLVVLTLRGVVGFITYVAGRFAFVLVQTKVKVGAHYELLQREDPAFLSAAEINFRNNEVADKAGTYISSLSTLLNSFLQATFMLGVLFWISWETAAIGVAVFGVAGIFIRSIHNRIKPLAENMPVEGRKLVRGIERISRNWLLVRILRTQDMEYERQVQSILQYASNYTRIMVLTTLNMVMPTLVGGYLIVVLIFVNINFINLEGAAFISFIYMFLRFQQALANGMGTFSALASNRPHFDIAASIFTAMNTVDFENVGRPPQKLNILSKSSPYNHIRRFGQEDLLPQSKPPEIRVDNVSFRYTDESVQVLSDFSVFIPSGCQFAIVGPSGSGKSTLLGLILGVLHPTGGNVSIDEFTPTDFFNKRASNLGYVGADPLLIDGTIADNLRYGASKETDVSEPACLEALELAHLGGLIAENPDFLNHKINENGEGLSAGQKQRLSLARALLNKPQLLILDEVSANLDSDTEAEIAQVVAALKGACTTIIVSHRQGMLTHADSILPMDKVWKTSTHSAVEEV